MHGLQINPLTPSLGAEVSGIDLSVLQYEPGQETATENGALLIGALQQAFLDHHVLFFRNQKLNATDLVQFASVFGTVGAYPFAQPLAGHPKVISIIKEPEQNTVFGGIWHTDSAYLEEPSMASVLYSIEVPGVGGDTLFANMYDAFDALEEPLKKKLATLSAVHSSAKNQHRLRKDHLQSGVMKETKTDVREATHPVIRCHPQSGRPSLYLSPAHTSRFVGESPEQSEPLLRDLFEHALADDFKCRFRWTPGTLAIWDNRCLLHYPINDYPGQRREMLRVTIDGDKPMPMPQS